MTSRERSRDRELVRITVIGIVFNIFLVIFKFLAGWFGRSAAMLADSVHSLSDFVTDVIVLVFIRLSSRPVDSTHAWGHGKFETMATLIVSVILLVVGVGILWHGGRSIIMVLRGGYIPRPGMIAFYAALVSLVSKEILFWMTREVGERTGSQVIIAAAWHHRSDALTSIGAAVGIGGAIFLGEKWRILDPIAAVLVSVVIFKIAIELSLGAVKELLEHSLPEQIEAEIMDIIHATPNVEEPHSLRTRRIGANNAIEIHICVNGDESVSYAHGVANMVEERLRERFGENTQVVVHIEPKGCEMNAQHP